MAQLIMALLIHGTADQLIHGTADHLIMAQLIYGTDDT